MSSPVLQNVLDVLNDSAGISDPRMDKFLMKSPLQFITIIAVYFAIIFKFGPQFMKHRKPYSLRPIIIAYNVLQIFINVYLFIAGLRVRSQLRMKCVPSNGDGQVYTQLVHYHYLYILLKYFDLVETVFYVLRKKDKQISFLHVYHHVGILLAAWVSGKYFPGGQAYFVAFYNTLIHGIMYCYYLVTSLNPDGAKFVWWKKYVTLLQIIQHCGIFLSILPAIVNINCTYPKGWMTAFATNVLVIIYLFVKFYKNSYLKQKSK